MARLISIEPGEELLPVLVALQRAAGGRKTHKSAAYRWMGKGSHGHRLPWVMLGSLRMTSVEAVRRWMAAVTAAADHAADQQDDAPTARQRTREIERAEKSLAEAGY